MNKPRKKIFLKIRHKYRLVILKEGSLEEKASFKLSRMNLIMAISSFVVVWSVLIFLLVAKTPLKLYIPGYADFDTRKTITELALRADSLENAIVQRELYIDNIRKIFSGNVAEYTQPDNTKPDTAAPVKSAIPDEPSDEEVDLRSEIEQQDKNELLYNEQNIEGTGLKNLVFFPPVRGVITEKFIYQKGHFAIDIAIAPNTGVKSTLDGTVISTGWDINTGYVIMVQHSNNLVSVYKHNTIILKKTGNFVKAGEVIALSGGSGELSTGSHLHFELWYDGRAINPEEYISF